MSDCSLNLDKKGKATLNLLETIPLSSGNESKEVKSVKVVTRVEATKDAPQQTDDKEKSKSLLLAHEKHIVKGEWLLRNVERRKLLMNKRVKNERVSLKQVQCWLIKSLNH